MNFLPTWGEKTISAWTPVPVLRNASGVIVDVAMSGYQPGVYYFAGSFLFHVLVGKTLYNHHVDIGTNPASIDTAPAGGSAYGCHDPVAGDAYNPELPGGGTASNPGNVATLAKIAGSRILQITGPEHVYMRCICAHNGPTADGRNGVYASGCLNFHRIANLP